jgi:hypothetical protein
MRKVFFLLLLILQANFLIAQEVKTKKRKLDVAEGTATFYVLASCDTIKQGDYQVKSYTGSRILLKGSYDKNKKVGLWQEQYYGKEYKGPKATGHYQNDIKTGEWTYFNYEGDTVQVYNWTENRVVMSKPCGTDLKEYIVLADGKGFKSRLDCPPTCVSGMDYFLYEFGRHIGEHAHYFEKAGNQFYQLMTKISITIDQNSSVTEIAFSTEEKKELKQVIDKFIRAYKWLPGKKDGKNVTTLFEFSVNLSSQY